MPGEHDFIARLRSLATHDAARGLRDDAAVLDIGGERIVMTHDALVEGVHFLSDDPPEDVAWKLIAVNLSDLAAKGATPLGALMGYSLVGNPDWDARFVDGLARALDHFGVALLGGDTVNASQRHIGMTMIGRAQGNVPSRSGAREGDALFVTGWIGDAGLGLIRAQAGGRDCALVQAYRRPQPQLAAGLVLAPVVTAMMDVSDGLLIDVARLAAASQVAAMINLDAVPLSPPARDAKGDDRTARLAAVSAGDDYQLLFTSALPLPALPCPITRIGQMVRGAGLHLHDHDGAVPLPVRLGWEHG